MACRNRHTAPRETTRMSSSSNQQRIAALAPIPKPANMPKYGTGVIPIEKPIAPGTVARGRPIRLNTNLYKLNLGSRNIAAFSYTVKISQCEKSGQASKKRPSQRGPARERRLSAKLNRKVFALVSREAAGGQLLAYDGRQRAWALQRIPNDGMEEIVDFEGDKWKVILIFENSVSLDGVRFGENYFREGDQEESMQPLHLIMNRMPSLEFTPIGKGFYGLPNEIPKPISGGLESWYGFRPHVIPTENGLCWNVNLATTTFIQPGNLIKLLPDLLCLRDKGLPPTLHPKQIEILKEKLSRCKAEVTHLKKGAKSITIATITSEPANRLFFNDRNNRRVSVADYFAEAYSKLRFPEYPCVSVGVENPNFFPLEVVTIKPGNPFRGELAPQAVRDVIRIAGIPPRDRLNKIRDIVEVNRQRSQLESEFDMEIGEEVVVQGRILPPPTLIAGRGQTVTAVNPGVINFKNNSFFVGSQIDKWTVIITDDTASQREVDRFVSALMEQAASAGIRLAEPLKKPGGEFHNISDRVHRRRVGEFVEKLVRNNRLQFVLFVISERTQIHAILKRMGDVELAVSSKCVKTKTIRKVNDNKSRAPDQCVVNILYGLNPKFGGENVVGISTEFAHNLLSSCPTLIIGMDVNHGQAKVREGIAKMPSTVGIVGTRNMNGTLFNAYMGAQRKPSESADREIIQSHILKPALTKIFEGFRVSTQHKPKRVIVFRDGVSDGQFQAVLQKEMKAIMEVCSELYGKEYRPPITFVLVKKRHDVRLFPEKFTGRWQNPVAGTVVDSEMTDPRVRDFYMVSPEGIQGTSRPAHYVGLTDENKMDNDQLQNLAYYLCHLYGKCPRSVSLPSPTYYAHHVAFRAAELGASLFHESPMAQNMTRCRSPEEAERLERAIVDIYDRATQIQDAYAGTMYFL